VNCFNAEAIKMKNLPLVVLVCLIMIPFSAEAQSNNADSTSLRHGDVQNIGNRNITGRIFGVLPNQVSLEQEVVLGQQMATEFEQTVKLLKDPTITEYIDALGQNLVRHSDAKALFHIKVVDADAADVLALPGGFLYVDKGLILEAESESELAGAMAHAIAHVCARHATRLQSTGQYLQIAASSAVPPVGSSRQTAIQNDLGLGINLELVGIYRKFEMEADQLGIQYLWNTGYDPHAFVSLLERMQGNEESNPKRSAILRTHPSTADRIAQCLLEEQALPKKDLYITTSPEFDRVKARLLADR
jgi:predicted Zn-dependent protease